MKQDKKRWYRKMAAGLGMTAALMGVMVMGAPYVYAAELSGEDTQAESGNTQVSLSGELDMSTNYPGVTIKPGENVSFDLNFRNGTGEGRDVSLSVTELPEGWQGFFRGDAGQIHKVHISSSQDGTEDLAEFSLTVPEEAEEGIYEVKLQAAADTGETDELTLELDVNEEENGSSTFTAEYPEQQAASGTSFSFDTTLVNNKGTDQSYSLSAEAPAGWEVGFTPSGESSQVASLNVEAGSSQGITVSVTPPETLTEGEYSIPISAISASEKLSAELKVTITGAYDVELSTPTGRLSADAYANDEKAITLSVTNTGNVELTNLNLTSSAPSNWEVRFDESTIETLEPGATKEITAYVKPDQNAMTGDYVTSLTVSNNETTAGADFRISVKTHTSWGIAAGAVILVLLAVLGMIFKKYGRR